MRAITVSPSASTAVFPSRTEHPKKGCLLHNFQMRHSWIPFSLTNFPSGSISNMPPPQRQSSHSFSQISRAPNDPKRMAQTPEHAHSHPCTICPGFSNWPRFSPKPANHCEGTARAIPNRHGLSAGPLDWQVQSERMHTAARREWWARLCLQPPTMHAESGQHGQRWMVRAHKKALVAKMSWTSLHTYVLCLLTPSLSSAKSRNWNSETGNRLKGDTIWISTDTNERLRRFLI